MDELDDEAPPRIPSTASTAPPPAAMPNNNKRQKKKKHTEEVQQPPVPPPDEQLVSNQPSNSGSTNTTEESRSSCTHKQGPSQPTSGTTRDTKLPPPRVSRRREDHNYRGWFYESLPSSGRPGTPHRFFASSYQVVQQRLEQNDANDNGGSGSDDKNAGKGQPLVAGGVATKLWPTLHRNANGLVVVTAVPSPSFLALLKATESSSLSSGHIPQLRIVVTTSGEGSDANDEEGQDARAATNDHDDEESPKRPVVASAGVWRRPQRNGATTTAAAAVVRPTDTLAVVTVREVEDGVERTLAVVPCGVSGTVVEVNDALTWDIWLDDPLLNGYLAVVRPIGTFPPPPPR